MSIHTAYHIDAVSALVNNIQLVGNGLADGDDAVMVEMKDDIGTQQEGADGSSVFSQHAGRAATITIKIMHGSPVQDYLEQLLELQYAGQLNGIPFSVRDRRNSEGGTADKCHLMSVPAISKGKAATTREYKLTTGYFKRNITTQGA